MHLRYIVLFVSLRWVRLPPWNRFKPSSKYFTDRSKAVLLLWIICVIYVLYFSCVGVCSWLPCGHLLGNGWPLGSCLWYVFVTFPCGILGQVWYLIASIPEFCRLSYFSWWHVAVIVFCIFLTVSTMDWSTVCGISLPYTLTFLASSVSTYTYELFTLRGENKTLAKLRNHSVVNSIASDLGLHWLPMSLKGTIGIYGLAQALFVLVHIEATSPIFENRTASNNYTVLK